MVADGKTKEACFERIMSGTSMYGTAFGLREVPVKITPRSRRGIDRGLSLDSIYKIDLAESTG